MGTDHAPALTADELSRPRIAAELNAVSARLDRIEEAMAASLSDVEEGSDD
jgi:hypothetical protein